MVIFSADKLLQLLSENLNGIRHRCYFQFCFKQQDLCFILSFEVEFKGWGYFLLDQIIDVKILLGHAVVGSLAACFKNKLSVCLRHKCLPDFFKVLGFPFNVFVETFKA